MKKNNKFMVFVLLIVLIVSMAAPVFADDSVPTEGAVNQTDQIITEDAIVNPTTPALDGPSDQDQDPPQNVQKKKSQDPGGNLSTLKPANKNVMATNTTSIPGLEIIGEPDGNFVIKDGPDANYFYMTITGGSITISGETERAFLIDASNVGNTEIIFKNVDATNGILLFSGENRDMLSNTNITVEGHNKFGRFGIMSWSGFSALERESKYTITGINGGTLTSSSQFDHYEGGKSQGSIGLISYHFELNDLKIEGNLDVFTNSIKSTNVDFDVNILQDFSARNEMSFFGCSGEMRYFTGFLEEIFSAISADQLDIKMNDDEELKVTGITPDDPGGNPVLSMSNNNDERIALSIRFEPTLVDTTITVPEGGLFKTYGEEILRFTVFDSNNNIAQNVVFSGNVTEEDDPMDDPVDEPVDTDKQNDTKPTEPKTADNAEPWALMTAMILVLIALAFSVRKRVLES